MVERSLRKREAGGSIPPSSNPIYFFYFSYTIRQVQKLTANSTEIYSSFLLSTSVYPTRDSAIEVGRTNIFPSHSPYAV